MNTGQIISGAGHLGLIGWALLGGLVQPAPSPFEVAEVTAISAEDYAALMEAEQAPKVTPDVTVPAVPEMEDAAPGMSSEPDAAPGRADMPPPAERATPDSAPETKTPAASPDAELTDSIPDLSPPPGDVAVLAPDIAARARPRPAPRVAPNPVRRPAPDLREDDVARPETAPAPSDRTTETPREEASAPPEATTEIVTEAEQAPARAPAASVRPRVRPQTASRQAADTTDTPAQEARAPEEEAVTAALAEALGGGDVGGVPDPPDLSAPRITAGEREALRLAVQTCWVVDPGSESARVVVTVAFNLDREGKVEGDIQRLAAEGGDKRAQNSAFEAARRAILRCGARGFDLPPGKYAAWRSIEMTFNPEKMRIK